MTARAFQFVLGLAFLIAGPAGPVAAQSAEPPISLQLNKMTQYGDDCRIYFLIVNRTTVRYDAFTAELVIFGDDGVIDRRFTGDLSPLRADKSLVVSFDMAGLKCRNVSQVLLNDITACTDSTGRHADCVDQVHVDSRAGVALFK